MAYKVFIDGESGTTGLEIKKRIEQRKDLNLLSIEESKRKDLDERLKFYRDSDIVFLCLPDDQAKEIVDEIDFDVRLIDASTAHRTDDKWVYGLPELHPNQRNLIANSNMVSNPGCHATGFILLIRPLIDEGILSKDAFLSVNSLTGYSGGGKAMIREYSDSSIVAEKKLLSPRQYGLSQSHKHIPEMVNWTVLSRPPVFTPIVDDYYRGMLVSIPLHIDMLEGKLKIDDIITVYKERYGREELAKVVKSSPDIQNGFLNADEYKDRDDFEIMVCGNDERFTLVARYDNLGKGASGAAIQNMNIMLGISQSEGLRLTR